MNVVQAYLVHIFSVLRLSQCIAVTISTYNWLEQIFKLWEAADPSQLAVCTVQHVKTSLASERVPHVEVESSPEDANCRG